VTLLRKVRIFFGLATEDDLRERHRDMLQKVQDAINEYDRRDVVDERAPVERRRPRKW
jgi:hypothetical protein